MLVLAPRAERTPGAALGAAARSGDPRPPPQHAADKAVRALAGVAPDTALTASVACGGRGALSTRPRVEAGDFPGCAPATDPPWTRNSRKGPSSWDRASQNCCQRAAEAWQPRDLAGWWGVANRRHARCTPESGVLNCTPRSAQAAINLAASAGRNWRSLPNAAAAPPADCECEPPTGGKRAGADAAATARPSWEPPARAPSSAAEEEGPRARPRERSGRCERDLASGAPAPGSPPTARAPPCGAAAASLAGRMPAGGGGNELTSQGGAEAVGTAGAALAAEFTT